MTPFQPLVRNPHLQTILGHLWPRPAADARFPVERRVFQTEPDIRVVMLSQRPPGEAAGEIVMVHGLEGSADSGYMQSLAAAALEAGFAAHRFNLRTCGGTESLSRTLYHAGLTSDLAFVLRRLPAPVFLAGFSLGGNVVLKLAAELGESAPETIRGVAAVSTPLDLAACARRIAEPRNVLYQRRFVRRMRARLCATGRYRASEFADLRSVIAIDDRITAPSFGFGTAENYYRTQSALGYLHRLRVPTLLIQSKDDTFIRFDLFESGAVRANPFVRVIATETGGHLGFVARGPRRFWADAVIMEWIVQNAGRPELSSSRN
jgi:predicted alpha/beta-fold hydrolase